MRVLGRVERFDGRLQLQVRAPRGRRRRPGVVRSHHASGRGRLEGFLEFLAAEITHDGLSAIVTTILGETAGA